MALRGRYAHKKRPMPKILCTLMSSPHYKPSDYASGHNTSNPRIETVQLYSIEQTTSTILFLKRPAVTKISDAGALRTRENLRSPRSRAGRDATFEGFRVAECMVRTTETTTAGKSLPHEPFRKLDLQRTVLGRRDIECGQYSRDENEH